MGWRKCEGEGGVVFTCEISCRVLRPAPYQAPVAVMAATAPVRIMLRVWVVDMSKRLQLNKSLTMEMIYILNKTHRGSVVRLKSFKPPRLHLPCFPSPHQTSTTRPLSPSHHLTTTTHNTAQNVQPERNPHPGHNDSHTHAIPRLRCALHININKFRSVQIPPTQPFTRATRTAGREYVGSGEFAPHDGCAGRKYEGVGGLCWGNVSCSSVLFGFVRGGVRVGANVVCL